MPWYSPILACLSVLRQSSSSSWEKIPCSHCHGQGFIRETSVTVGQGRKSSMQRDCTIVQTTTFETSAEPSGDDDIIATYHGGWVASFLTFPCLRLGDPRKAMFKDCSQVTVCLDDCEYIKRGPILENKVISVLFSFDKWTFWVTVPHELARSKIPSLDTPGSRRPKSSRGEQRCVSYIYVKESANDKLGSDRLSDQCTIVQSGENANLPYSEQVDLDCSGTSEIHNSPSISVSPGYTEARPFSPYDLHLTENQTFAAYIGSHKAFFWIRPTDGFQFIVFLDLFDLECNGPIPSLGKDMEVFFWFKHEIWRKVCLPIPFNYAKSRFPFLPFPEPVTEMDSAYSMH